MKKPGFLNRIFSFGRKKHDEPITEIKNDEPQSASLQEISKTIDVNIEPELPSTGIIDTIDIEISASSENELLDDLERPENRPNITANIEVPRQSIEDASITKTDSESQLTIDAENKLDDQAEMRPVLFEPVGKAVPTEEASIDSLKDVLEEKSKPAVTAHIVKKQDQPDENKPESDAQEKQSWFKRLSKGLSRSSAQLSGNIAAVFTKKKLDDNALEELEDILLQADLGVETTLSIIDSLAKQRMGKDVTETEVRGIMAEEIEKTLAPIAMPLELDLEQKPHVILVVGVNGSGKTTTIGKLSQKLADADYTTMLAAGDTFRAAAIEQLEIWGERTNSPVISKPLGSDSSGLAYDAWLKAKEQQSDILIMDTAGRLQNKQELMAELEKIIRVFKKHDSTAPHTVLLTLDATTGQNALSQVEAFQRVAGVNGLIMTKLDGSARGGILVAISAKYKLPVYFIGVGEQVEDLEPFEAREFARSIAGLDA